MGKNRMSTCTMFSVKVHCTPSPLPSMLNCTTTIKRLNRQRHNVLTYVMHVTGGKSSLIAVYSSFIPDSVGKKRDQPEETKSEPFLAVNLQLQKQQKQPSQPMQRYEQQQQQQQPQMTQNQLIPYQHVHRDEQHLNQQQQQPLQIPQKEPQQQLTPYQPLHYHEQQMQQHQFQQQQLLPTMFFGVPNHPFCGALPQFHGVPFGTNGLHQQQQWLQPQQLMMQHMQQCPQQQQIQQQYLQPQHCSHPSSALLSVQY
jgi:hypothetical protein